MGGMFSAAGDDDTGEQEVARISLARRPTSTPSEAPTAAVVVQPQPQPRVPGSKQLRVSEYGAEEFWHERWSGATNAQAGYEWFTVSAAELWPTLKPLCLELRLTTASAAALPLSGLSGRAARRSSAHN